MKRFRSAAAWMAFVALVAVGCTEPTPSSMPTSSESDRSAPAESSVPGSRSLELGRPSIPRAADGSSANPWRVGRPLVIPHSGGDGLFPENTMLAFERSQALGGDVIDLDVWVSADGVPMVIHDPTVDRTTDGTGRVAEMTVADLHRLDAGYDFAVGEEFPFRGQGLTIPTVASVLSAFPDRLTTLDMKDRRVESVESVCAVVRAADRGPRLYVGIDVDEQVVAFREICPEVFTSGTSTERSAARAAREAGDVSFRSEQLVGQPGYLDDDGNPRITAETLEFSHRSGTAILTWVIDDKATMNTLIDLGIDGIYTRRPDVLVEVLAERGLIAGG